MTKCVTSEYGSKVAPAEIVMGKRLRGARSSITKDGMLTNNPSVNLEWKDWWSKKEAVMQGRYPKDFEVSPGVTPHLKPLKVYTKVFTRSRTVKAPLRWDRTGAVREFLPSDQHIVTVHGAGRISRRNRKFLRADVPAMEEKGSRLPYDQDIGMECEADSAWGARGHMTQSADSNNGPGGGSMDGGAQTRDAAPPDSQKNSYGAKSVNGPGRKVFGVK